MIGQSIGSYVIKAQIGEGGMGSVWLGEHKLLGKKAAIKILLPELSSDQQILTRFFNEAKATTTIRHPSIVEIFDFGYSDAGSAFIVMELLEGESLTGRLRKAGKLPVPQAVALVRQMAGALAAAHAQGIVHRDLKPDNIYIVSDPEVAGGERIKILDFGIAKLKSASAAGQKTRTGSVLGTPMYMSPEQCRGMVNLIDHRTDIYALGCVFFEMLCGRAPFPYDGLGQLINAHITQQPPTPSSVEPSIPPAIDAVFLHTVEKRIEQRTASMEALIAELDRTAPTGAPGGARPLPPTMMAWSAGPAGAPPAGAPPAPAASAPPAAAAPSDERTAFMDPRTPSQNLPPPPRPISQNLPPGARTPSQNLPPAARTPSQNLPPDTMQSGPPPGMEQRKVTTLGGAAGEQGGQRAPAKRSKAILALAVVSGCAVVAAIVGAIVASGGGGDGAKRTASFPGVPVEGATEPAAKPTEPAAKPTEPAAAPTEPAPAPTEPAAKPTEPAPAATVKLTVDSEPPGAEVYLAKENKKLGVTPYVHEMPAGDAMMIFKLKLKGYDDAKMVLRSDKDDSGKVTLHKRGRGGGRPGGAGDDGEILRPDL